MYEDNALHINRMKKKEDMVMQTKMLLEKTKPNCRFMTYYYVITDVIITVMTS